MKLPVSHTTGSVKFSTDENVKTAYSYVRFSTPQQSLGDSTRRQVEAAEQFCKENGYALDKSITLHDKGVSAFKGANTSLRNSER
ncbi:MAG TPA: recombinase family protein [Verrucomicrobiae bacterium]|nr:recombinase family protein [Verrucomicrobiae bacterium]